VTILDRIMAAAPKILFWVAVAILLLSFAGHLLVRSQNPHFLGFFELVPAFSIALQDAFWPFVGAAVAWRMDRPFKVVKAEAAE